MMTVKLELPKSSAGLAGYEYGKEVFNKQIGDVYKKESGKLKIVFPPNIERVASSFVQGFFSIIVEEHGYDVVQDRIILEAKSKELEEDIWQRLY